MSSSADFCWTSDCLHHREICTVKTQLASIEPCKALTAWQRTTTFISSMQACAQKQLASLHFWLQQMASGPLALNNIITACAG